jgi:HAD superfamily hydrolase (TIGR01509 family)
LIYAVLSCVEHLIKPDPAFYQLAIKKADSLPSEAVFIDDKKEFTDMAEKMGIKSILYLGDNERLLNEFKELGICEE